LVLFYLDQSLDDGEKLSEYLLSFHRIKVEFLIVFLNEFR